MKKEVIINDKKFIPYIPREEINKAVRNLAEDIDRDYEDKHPLFLVILKGAVFFATDLLRKLSIDGTLEMVRAQSYGSEMKSSGTVVLSDENISFKGRDVIIVEDIVDTGLTLKTLMESIEKESPASVECAVLISKTEMRQIDVRVKYTGIEIPDVFVVGYGLDYAEKGRFLPEIYGLSTG